MYICPRTSGEVWTIFRRGTKPSCTACWVSENTPVIMACEAIMVANMARITTGNLQTPLYHLEERMFHRPRVIQQQGALAEVVQRERRVSSKEPGLLHRGPPEVADVRVQRFASGYGQQDRAHDMQRLFPLIDEVHHPVVGGKRPQNTGVVDQMDHAKHCQRAEPDDHDGTKSHANLLRAKALHHEKSQQNA